MVQVGHTYKNRLMLPSWKEEDDDNSGTESKGVVNQGLEEFKKIVILT